LPPICGSSTAGTSGMGAARTSCADSTIWPQGAPARLSWARLLKRVFDIDIEQCPNCGGSLKIIACRETCRRAAIEDPPLIVKILAHRALPPRPAALPARRFDLFQTI